MPNDDFPDTVPMTRPRNENIIPIRRRLSDAELGIVVEQVIEQIYLRAGRRAIGAIFGFLVRYGGAGVSAVFAWEAAKALGLDPEKIISLIHTAQP